MTGETSLPLGAQQGAADEAAPPNPAGRVSLGTFSSQCWKVARTRGTGPAGTSCPAWQPWLPG